MLEAPEVQAEEAAGMLQEIIAIMAANCSIISSCFPCPCLEAHSTPRIPMRLPSAGSKISDIAFCRAGCFLLPQVSLFSAGQRVRGASQGDRKTFRAKDGQIKFGD
jgi:hypothetical protein